MPVHRPPTAVGAVVVLLVGALLVPRAAASPLHHRTVSRADVLAALTRGDHLRGVDPAFECAWRTLALEFAAQVQPFRPSSALREIHDALQLGTLCNATFAAGGKTPGTSAANRGASTLTLALARPSPDAASPATTLYVAYDSGSDAAPGTLSAPLQHVAVAVAKARALPKPAEIVLRGGVHRLRETLQLGAADAGLSIRAYDGETPTLSSGAVLTTAWEQADVTPRAAAGSASAAGTATRSLPPPWSASADDGAAPACDWQAFEGVDAMYNDWPSPTVHNMSTAASAQACASQCQAAAKTGGCYSWIWYAADGAFGDEWKRMCFFRTDPVWSPSKQADTFSGYCAVPPPPPNVWVTDLAKAGTPLPPAVYAEDRAVTLFTSPDGGASTQRAFRARWPNADLELDLFPKGWASGATRTPQACNESSFNVTHVPMPDNYGPGMFTDYYFGQGGTCDRFEEGEWLHGPSTVSYWCQVRCRGAHSSWGGQQTSNTHTHTHPSSPAFPSIAR